MQFAEFSPYAWIIEESQDAFVQQGLESGYVPADQGIAIQSLIR
ncbi:MAG: hypothetical protein ACJAT5_000199 [Lentimonas sp.]